MAQTSPTEVNQPHPDVKANAAKIHAEVKKDYEAQREQRARLTEEAIKRSQSGTPTPTQEENDLARLGIHVEQKKEDGTGPTVIETRTTANVPLSAHGYEPRHDEQKEREAREARERETVAGQQRRPIPQREH